MKMTAIVQRATKRDYVDLCVIFKSRSIVPYLRGSSSTEFLSQQTPRVGSGVVLAQAAI
jgi:hypothetical protein